MQGGQVTFDGVDVRKLDLEFLRDNIGIVGQETYLFNGTIRENLLYAKPDATEEQIQEAINPIIDSRTSILIVHRLSAILAADEILIIKDGRVVERGVHADLVKTGGIYTELYETQFCKAIDSE